MLPAMPNHSQVPRPRYPVTHRSAICSPRAQQFSSRSPTVQTEQQQQSIFDAEQQKLDKQLDKSLNICRC
jgi:hypothetical protein